MNKTVKASILIVAICVAHLTVAAQINSRPKPTLIPPTTVLVPMTSDQANVVRVPQASAPPVKPLSPPTKIKTQVNVRPADTVTGKPSTPVVRKKEQPTHTTTGCPISQLIVH